MLFVIKLIGSKSLFQENTALYICFTYVKRARFGPFYICEKGQIWPAGRTLGTTDLNDESTTAAGKVEKFLMFTRIH